MKWVGVVLLLLGLLSLVWAFLFLSVKPHNCPSSLPESYYTCASDADCSYHPRYECINNKALNCVETEDLSVGEEIGRMFYCRCVNHRCITERVSRH